MKITLLAEDVIRLEPTPGPLTIEAESAEMQYSPFHMLASGLASCTFSVLYSWATHAKLSVDDLSLEVHWQFGDDPHRVSDLAVIFDWPSLPAGRHAAAKRVAELCTIHATLTHPPTIEILSAADVPAHEHGHDDGREHGREHGSPEPTGPAMSAPTGTGITSTAAQSDPATLVPPAPPEGGMS
jgi:uncharacterized OsmC-like protein